MEEDKYKALSFISVGLATRVDNLCKLLVKKGVLTEDDIKQINSDTEKEMTTLFEGIHHG